MSKLEGGALLQVSDINKVGLKQGDTRPERVQKLEEFAGLASTPKGKEISFFLKNTSGAAANFVLFDKYKCASEAGYTHSNDITIETSFPGGYNGFLESLAGMRRGVLGIVLDASSEDEYKTLAFKLGNGNDEDYQFKSMNNKLKLGKVKVQNDGKLLIIPAKLWLNGFLSIRGTLQAGSSIDIMFNVEYHQNY